MKPDNFLSCLQPRRQWWRLPVKFNGGCADLRAGLERRKDRAAHLMLSPVSQSNPPSGGFCFSAVSQNKRSPAADDLQFFSFMPSREFTMTSPAPACASDASLDENRIPFSSDPHRSSFHFSFLRCFRSTFLSSLKVFDLMALAGAGLTALVAGAVLTKSRCATGKRSWKAPHRQ